MWLFLLGVARDGRNPLDPSRRGMDPATVTDATLYGKGPFGGVKGIESKF